MSKLEKLKEKARSLEAKDPKGAIEAWQHVLKGQEEEGDPNPDLAIFNRIGDLYLKVREPAQAADYYDQAVDKYAELGFHNNAIAMCNKVLRNAPGRQTTYLKLAKLYAAKGFMAEAKQNFVEYAGRMQKAGKIQQAFSALKEFTDISPQIESTSLVEGLEPTNVPLEGFETTSADFGEVRLEANEVESLREEVTAEDVRPRADLEPTVPDEAETATESEIDLEPLLDIEIESPAPP